MSSVAMPLVQATGRGSSIWVVLPPVECTEMVDHLVEVPAATFRRGAAGDVHRAPRWILSEYSQPEAPSG